MTEGPKRPKIDYKMNSQGAFFTGVADHKKFQVWKTKVASETNENSRSREFSRELHGQTRLGQL